MSPLFIVLALVGIAAAILALQPHKFTLYARRDVTLRGLLADNVGAIPFEQISRDAQIALTEFGEEFMTALSQSDVDPWSAQLGLDKVSDAPRVRFPIPLSAAGYKEFTGDVQYRTIWEKSLEIIPVTWFDGVDILARTLEAPDFVGWEKEPDLMAAAAISLGNELIAQQLINNPATWETNDGSINFFHSVNTASPSFSAGKHPFNIMKTSLGGFDNDFTGATLPSHQNLQIAKTRFRRILAANGRPAGFRLTHILAPPAQEEVWRNILEQDLIIQSLPLTTTQGDGSGATFGAVSNRHKGTVQLVIADELGGSYVSPTTGATGSDAYWYGLALNKPGAYPWITHRQATPEVVINDKASDYYKRTRKVSMAHFLDAVGALALPQCVQRWAGTSS